MNAAIGRHARSEPPRPVTLGHLRPSDRHGWMFTTAAGASSAGGWWLATAAQPALWIAGQFVLALALVQWFVILHECGHGTMFARRTWNRVVGHLAGLLSLIPFEIWTRIHARHHRWTGWQDVDPTTAALAPRPLSGAERALVNVCWRTWIPLFATLYRLNNFWNVPRLWTLFPARQVRRLILGSLAAHVIVLGLIGWAIGPAMLLKTAGAALVIAFMAEEILIVSQHTHIPMPQSGGRVVRPHRALAQEVFTRSMRLPGWLSRLTLQFDAHELHHMYPFVPGYLLHRVPYTPVNEVSWRRWIPAARSMPGEVLFFQNRDGSGFDL